MMMHKLKRELGQMAPNQIKTTCNPRQVHAVANNILSDDQDLKSKNKQTHARYFLYC